MTIQIDSEFIRVGTVVLKETPTGIVATGAVQADFTTANLGPSQPEVGTVSGYTSGGLENNPAIPFPSEIHYNIIDKFPFATNANATDVGDMTTTKRIATGQSSTTHGYNSGGAQIGAVGGVLNIIDRFPFASNGNASDVGDLTSSIAGAAGHSSDSSGYSAGGVTSIPTNAYTLSINKFPFAVNANASDVGNLNVTKQRATGHSSGSHGYTGQAYSSGPIFLNTIDRFPFATNIVSSKVGDTSPATVRQSSIGQSSTTHGYISGGSFLSPDIVTSNTIEKFLFSTNVTTSDVGDLTNERNNAAGQSSTTNGYNSGGSGPFAGPPARTNIIDKFPFATDSNATDVGDLTASRVECRGQQD